MFFFFNAVRSLTLIGLSVRCGWAFSYDAVTGYGCFTLRVEPENQKRFNNTHFLLRAFQSEHINKSGSSVFRGFKENRGFFLPPRGFYQRVCMDKEEHHPSIRLSVTSTTGRPVELTVPRGETVDGLRNHICHKLRLQRDRIALLHKDRHLTAGTLLDQRVTDGSKLTLVPAIEAGLLCSTSRAERSTMDVLEDLTDVQINDFLCRRCPLSVSLRVGSSHMMHVQLQLSTPQPEGVTSGPLSSEHFSTWAPTSKDSTFPSIHHTPGAAPSSPSNPVHGPSSQSNPVHGPSSQSNSVHGPSSQSSQSIHGPSSLSNPVHGPSSQSNPVHGPSSQSNPVHDPSSQSNPVHGPSSQSNPVHGPSSQSNPVHGPSSQSNPVHGPSSQSNPVHGPSSQSNPVHGPSSQSNPVHGPSSQSSQFNPVHGPYSQSNSVHGPSSQSSQSIHGPSSQLHSAPPSGSTPLVLSPKPAAAPVCPSGSGPQSPAAASTFTETRDDDNMSQPGAVIESLVHHSPGVFSGTFSGSLTPRSQSSVSHPRRGVLIILQILNDLLRAAYSHQRASAPLHHPASRLPEDNHAHSTTTSSSVRQRPGSAFAHVCRGKSNVAQ
ncbi:midnolin-like isoform X2 [Gouania willdenowi]|uniref:midnolin-like isoform X2 n=1 Tax=Gouania willdenowi TaxID=441366 RepID=UPI001056A9AC|nr:midnolin-like isoform X2 [Gouania willdenowi]